MAASRPNRVLLRGELRFNIVHLPFGIFITNVVLSELVSELVLAADRTASLFLFLYAKRGGQLTPRENPSPRFHHGRPRPMSKDGFKRHARYLLLCQEQQFFIQNCHQVDDSD
jgi:hypothetical protein